MTRDLNSFLTEIRDGGVVVNLGQVSPQVSKTLDRMAKAGTLTKWRGKWFPVAGASFGIGPDKTCWALSATHAQIPSAS